MSQESKKTATTAIDPPSLELDLGYSLTDAKTSLKLKFSLGTIGLKKKSDPFSLSLSKWWVSWRGSRDGKKGVLRSGNESTSFEEHILRERHKKIHHIDSMVIDELAESRKLIEDLHVSDFSCSETLDKIRNQSHGWLRLFKEALVQARNNFESCKKSYEDSDSSLTDFVKDKKLHRKSLPSKMSLWDRGAGLIGLVIGETIISFPSVADKAGGGEILMSFLLPLTVSLANAFIGIVAGKIALHTYLNSEDIKHKSAAFIGFMITIFFALWMNLTVGLWREDIEFSLSNGTFIPTSAFSVILFVVGMCVYSFAVYKGLRDFSDGYPGHDEKWNEYSESKTEYDFWKGRYLYLVHEMRKTSQDTLDHVRGQISSLKKEYQERITYAEKIIIELQKIEGILPGLNESINSSARILLKKYRESACRHIDNGKLEINPKRYAWEVTLPDISLVRERADNLLIELKSSLEELKEFESYFEKDIAATINSEIEKVSEESKDAESVSGKPVLSFGS